MSERSARVRADDGKRWGLLAKHRRQLRRRVMRARQSRGRQHLFAVRSAQDLSVLERDQDGALDAMRVDVAVDEQLRAVAGQPTKSPPTFQTLDPELVPPPTP